MHVVCDGECAGVNVGRCGPSNIVEGSVRKWLHLSEGLVQSPYKSPSRMMRWLGYVVVSVLSAKQASVCFPSSGLS